MHPLAQAGLIDNLQAGHPGFATTVCQCGAVFAFVPGVKAFDVQQEDGDQRQSLLCQRNISKLQRALRWRQARISQKRQAALVST